MVKKNSDGTFKQDAVYRMIYRKVSKEKKKNTIKNAWKDFVNLGIIEPLLKNGSVKNGKYINMEIIGHKVRSTHPIHRLLKKGLIITAGGFIKKADNINNDRFGIIYKVNIKKLKKGIKFHPCPEIKKKLNQELTNPLKDYKIVIDEH